MLSVSISFIRKPKPHNVYYQTPKAFLIKAITTFVIHSYKVCHFVKDRYRYRPDRFSIQLIRQRLPGWITQLKINRQTKNRFYFASKKT